MISIQYSIQKQPVSRFSKVVALDIANIFKKTVLALV